MKSLISSIDWNKSPLLPVVTQDATSKEVLMMAYMNEEALHLTLQTNIAHYFSRSRQKLWKKGESSGHFQYVKEVYLDCDSDTLLLKVEQEGVACHTGRISCFFNRVDTKQEAHPLLKQSNMIFTIPFITLFKSENTLILKALMLLLCLKKVTIVF